MVSRDTDRRTSHRIRSLCSPSGGARTSFVKPQLFDQHSRTPVLRFCLGIAGEVVRRIAAACLSKILAWSGIGPNAHATDPPGGGGEPGSGCSAFGVRDRRDLLLIGQVVRRFQLRQSPSQCSIFSLQLADFGPESR